jgi:hypothetical protein
MFYFLLAVMIGATEAPPGEVIVKGLEGVIMALERLEGYLATDMAIEVSILVEMLLLALFIQVIFSMIEMTGLLNITKEDVKKFALKMFTE